jgi:YVTN family beta-propeller protein
MSLHFPRPVPFIACVVMTLISQTGRSDSAPLSVEAKIPLGAVNGRIDHLAFDPGRQRLYVAELGNNSIGIVDLKAGRVINTVPGFDEPQGIAYEASTDTIYVANGGDGSVRVFNATEFAPLGTIELHKDADNVRVDRATHRVYVGYGDGALSVIDPGSRRRVADIVLPGHPESFQLHPSDERVFVNVPDAQQVAVISRGTNRQLATWRTGDLRSNYPLTLDVEKSRVIAVFRHPARLQVFDMAEGHPVGSVEVCGDSDDVFLDSKRRRLYVICGEGFVDSIDATSDSLKRIDRLNTSSGARTGLFIPEMDRLVVAIRARGAEPTALWVLRPR